MGTTTRNVNCMDGRGHPVHSSACTSEAPSAEQACIVTAGAALASTENCQDASDACGAGTAAAGSKSHWQLNSTLGSCVCAPGWGGTLCDVPLLQPPPSTPCVDGVVDLKGVCCAGYVDTITGWCCGDSPVDRRGRCCANGTVDVCGICGGSGVAVDAQGTCCSSPLPPSGLCCVEGQVDSCGVCGGDNTCGWVLLHWQVVLLFFAHPHWHMVFIQQQTTY